MEEQNTNAMSYRYYSTERPINPGTFPTNRQRPVKIVNFGTRKNIGGIKAWGYLEYLKPLSDDDQFTYDLVMIN